MEQPRVVGIRSITPRPLGNGLSGFGWRRKIMSGQQESLSISIEPGANSQQWMDAIPNVGVSRAVVGLNHFRVLKNLTVLSESLRTPRPSPARCGSAAGSIAIAACSLWKKPFKGSVDAHFRSATSSQTFEPPQSSHGDFGRSPRSGACGQRQRQWRGFGYYCRRETPAPSASVILCR